MATLSLCTEIEHVAWQGTTWFQAKLDIEVSRASKTAIKAIERQGGKLTCGYYNKLGLRLLLKPEKLKGAGFQEELAHPGS